MMLSALQAVQLWIAYVSRDLSHPPSIPLLLPLAGHQARSLHNTIEQLVLTRACSMGASASDMKQLLRDIDCPSLRTSAYALPEDVPLTR
jgi:hypothetical protein